MKRFAILLACTVMLAGAGCCGYSPYGGGGGYGAGYAPTYGGGCPGGNCGAYGGYNGAQAAAPYYGQSAYMPMGQTAYMPLNVNPVY